MWMKITSKFRSLKIAPKLVVFVTTLLLIQALVLLITAIFISKESIQNLAFNNLQNATELRGKKLHDFYEKFRSDLITLQHYKKAINEKDSVEDEDKRTADIFFRSFVEDHKYSAIKCAFGNGELYYSTSENTTAEHFKQEAKQCFTQKSIYFGDVYVIDNTLMMNAYAPEITKNEIFGVISLSVNLSKIFDDLVSNNIGLGKSGEVVLAKKTEEGALFLNNLKHDTKSALNRKALNGNINAKPILEAVAGKAGKEITHDYRGEEVIAVWLPIPDFNWGLVAKIDTNEAFSSVFHLQVYIFIVVIIMSFISFLITRKIATKSVTPIIKLNESMKELGKGNSLNRKIVYESNDEIGQMIHSANSMAENQNKVILFAKDVGRGKFNTESDDQNLEGELGLELRKMRDGLKEAAEREELRNWMNKGLATFGEILRNNNGEPSEFFDRIIQGIVKYLKCNQGALYLYHEENTERKYLKLVSSYAYERKKHSEQIIEEGEGLLGECVLQRDYIYVTDVPQDFVNITSGLGEATPSCILIMPLIYNDELTGAFEIASFHPLKKHEIEFSQHIAENIASVLVSVKNNERTKILLQEAKEQAEQLLSQEEEMKQNLEEMQATQEEMERKERHMKEHIEMIEEKYKTK